MTPKKMKREMRMSDKSEAMASAQRFVDKELSKRGVSARRKLELTTFLEYRKRQIYGDHPPNVGELEV
jgi:hypothetical protein